MLTALSGTHTGACVPKVTDGPSSSHVSLHREDRRCKARAVDEITCDAAG